MTQVPWNSDRVPDLTGRTFVVTGSNSGLGLATTRHLAGHGALVVMAVRDEERGRRAAAEIRAAHPGAELEVRRLDLADLDSVRSFAAGLHERGADLDGLVNNAGVMGPPRSLSPQGYETQFAGNHLGHFALTGLLLDQLRAGADPRVVTVTSMLHRGARIDFDDLTGERNYAAMTAYGQSKLANLIFALELDRRLRAADSPVRSLAAHPGYTATNLQTTGPTGLNRLAGSLGNRLVAQGVERGILPQLYAATAPGVEGGQFFGPDGWREMRGHPTVVEPDPAALDLAVAERLWQVSEELTGVRFDLPAP